VVSQDLQQQLLLQLWALTAMAGDGFCCGCVALLGAGAGADMQGAARGVWLGCGGCLVCYLVCCC
jgi:hypothetical protein